MPIYEYECGNCGHHLEALQKVSEAPLRKCPECGKPALRKLMSAAGFRLKGGGWYETDFKSGKQRNLVGGDGEKPVKETAKEASKETSKEKKTAEPAAKSEKKPDNKKAPAKAAST